MDRSLFLARLVGPTLVAIALGMLINLGVYESMIAEALHTGILLYLSGLLSLLGGLAIVNLHNTWCADWRVIITVLGWLMTIGGIIRIVVPQIAVTIRFEHLWRSRQHDRSRPDHRHPGCLPQLQGLPAARLTARHAGDFINKCPSEAVRARTPAYGTFETCRAGLAKSVDRARPEATYSGPDRRS
jgi:hypothetical protein